MTAFLHALTILAARIRWPRSDYHQRRAARRSAARRLERVMK